MAPTSAELFQIYCKCVKNFGTLAGGGYNTGNTKNKRTGAPISKDKHLEPTMFSYFSAGKLLSFAEPWNSSAYVAGQERQPLWKGLRTLHQTGNLLGITWSGTYAFF